MKIAFKLRAVIFCLSCFMIAGVSGCASKEEKASQSTVVAAEKKEEETMVSDISTEVSESDVQLLSTELGLSDAQELEYSLQRLYSRGCTGIASVTKTKEESGWIYFVVESTDQQKFYVDTNKHGSFGTILSQDGRDNVDLMVQTLGIKENRNLLYSAEKMETSGCGRIESIKDVEHKKSYKFTIVNSDGVEYHISLSDNGEIGTIRDKDDQPVYEMKE